MDLWDLFFSALKRASPTPLFQTVDFLHEMEISRAMSYSSLQDPFRFRAKFLALAIATSLIDDRGNLQMEHAKTLQTELQNKKYLIGPYLENDLFLFEHIISCLETLLENELFRKQFLRLSPPLCHKGAERLIRETLWPKEIKELSSTDVKRAVLAAWFTTLRQTTGSCFATAPAILIQAEQPLQFLKDITDLLMTGALRRIVSGQEYAVPLCPSTEGADLLRSLGTNSPEALFHSPGLLAAFGAAALFPPLSSTSERRRTLRIWIENIEGAKTVKELIEMVLLRALRLSASDIKEEEGRKKLEMTPLLAKHSSLYYQRPSERSQKVSEWKQKVSLSLSAYQALGDCSLLRAWEATIASFSDVKVDIGRWNLYNSLGLHPDQAGGIGAFLYQRINLRLEKTNREILELRREYAHAIERGRMAERMRQTVEYNRLLYTANSILPQIEELSKKGELLATIFSKIIGEYDRLIPAFFQEIFDPTLTQNVAEMIDDSPAGFRLAYKHGRSASSQWTFIRSGEEFIRSLRDFFEYAERELGPDPMVEELSTELIQYIQKEEFLSQAHLRAKANPTMHGKTAKPWEYISGGSLPGLLQVYYNRSSPFTTFEKSIQTERELLSFLTECVKISPNSQSILIHSPTHAFILRPPWFPQDPMPALKEMEAFWDETLLQDVEWLAGRFSLTLSAQEQPLFLHRLRQMHSVSDLSSFRNTLIHCTNTKDPSRIDSFLYESLPLIPQKIAQLIATEITDSKTARIFFSDSPFFTPIDFREHLKAALATPFSERDLDLEIASHLRKRKLASPMPILFADTNWSAGFFGLAISPDKRLDLWRFQRTGMSGVPMRSWFNLQKEGHWIALCHPKEYA